VVIFAIIDVLDINYNATIVTFSCNELLSIVTIETSDSVGSRAQGNDSIRC
jgi:hypothetical protein